MTVSQYSIQYGICASNGFKQLNNWHPDSNFMFFMYVFFPLLYRPLRHSELWVLCQIPVLGKCNPYHPHLREVNKALLCKVGCPLLNAGQVSEVHAQVRDTWRITAVQTKQKYTVFMNWFETFSSAHWLYLLFQCLSEVLEPSLWWHNLLKSVPQSLCLKIMKKRVNFSVHRCGIIFSSSLKGESTCLQTFAQVFLSL